MKSVTDRQPPGWALQPTRTNLFVLVTRCVAEFVITIKWCGRALTGENRFPGAHLCRGALLKINRLSVSKMLSTLKISPESVYNFLSCAHTHITDR